MIDKKIEEAAKMYAWDNRSDEGGEENLLDKKRAFRTGINWFLGNLWHLISEEPKEERELLVKTYNDDEYHIVRNRDDWKELVRIYDITRLLYIEDLQEGGNHEQ